MKISKIPHYIKRATQLGPMKTLGFVSQRMQTSYFEHYKRYQAQNKRADFSWRTIAKREMVCDFPCYLGILQKKTFAFLPAMYQEDFIDKEELIKKAEKFTHNYFDLLGSGEQNFTKIPWHSDFRLKYCSPDSDYLFDKNTFYKDFIIQHGTSDTSIKDIKVPWELSRFQHVLFLGAAYEETKESCYPQAFIKQLIDWIDENPYLLGPNWVCPMDVGIRALNWIWGFHYFKDAPDISEESWEKIITSLYNHMIYLENNWEVGSANSNHYLSDLIGYFYLTWFFSDMPKVKKRHRWCHQELLKEFEAQIFDEGTDYEGSTSYHVLVTEIFYNFYFVCQESGFPLSQTFMEKLQKMFSFICWCTPEGGTMIKIGDDDSGKIVNGLSLSSINIMRKKTGAIEKFYKQFGLSIYKTKKWHATLRHHVYQENQPSGHFHNDVGSVTIAINGIAVIVDPGSYLYTPSALWRNTFRSVEQHNSFFISGQEPVAFSDDSLFTLEQPEQKEVDPFISQHSLYGYKAERKMLFDTQETFITLIDQWKTGKDHITGWNFTLAPHIVPYYNGTSWDLFYKNIKLLTVVSDDLLFEVKSGWYAPGYGTKVPCKQLVATKKISAYEKITIKLITG